MKSTLVLTLSLLVAACGSGAKMPSNPARASTVDVALDRLPAASKFVLAVDVTRLRDTPLGKRMLDRLGDLVAGVLAANNLRDICPLHLTDIELFVMGGGGQGQDAGGVIRGNLPEATVIGCMEKVLAAKGAKLLREPLLGRTAYHPDGSTSDNGWVAYAADGTPLIGGNREWLGLLLDPATPDARTNAPLAATIGRIDPALPMWLAMVFDEEIRAGMVAGSQGMIPHAPTALRIGVRVGEGLGVEAIGRFDDAAAAGKVAESLKGLLAQLGPRAAGQDPVVKHLLDGTRIEARDAEVSVRVEIPAADVDRIAELFASSARSTTGP